MRRANGRRRMAAAAAGVAAEPLERRTLMAAGAIDTTFGTAGFATAPGSAGTAVGVAVDAAGRTVEAHEYAAADGSGAEAIDVTRLLTSGAVDTSFGNGGLITLGEPATTATFGYTTNLNVVALPTGQTLIAGAYLFRLNGVGQVDATFAGGGAGVPLPVEATGMAVQANGDILIGGQSYTVGSTGDVPAAVYRYSANGVPDTTFGAAGKTVVAVPAALVAADFPDEAPAAPMPYVGGLALDPSGRLLVGLGLNYGEAPGELAVCRLSAGGIVDPSFGSFGGFAVGPSVTQNVTSEAVAVAATTGVIYQAGTYDADGGPNSDGVLYAFAADGTAVSPPDPNRHDVLSQTTDVAVQPDGKVLLSGWDYDNFDVTLPADDVYGDVVERYQPVVPGTTSVPVLDPTWGTAGVTVVAAYALDPATATGGLPNAIAVRAGGKVMFVGQRPSFDGGLPFAARVLGDAATAAAVGAINGTDFLDVNDDGRLDAGDTGLVGFGAFLDNNNDGVFDVGDVRSYSGAAGAYAFAALRPGTYHVVQVPSAGYVHTQPATGNGYAVTVVAGSSATANFGLRRVTGTISGTVFNDVNGNGAQDAGDAGQAGFGVYLDLNGNGVRDAADTQVLAGAGGAYAFTGLTPGTYNVRQNTPAGYVRTTAGFPVVVVVTAGSDTVVDIGNHRIAKKTGTPVGTPGSLNNSGNTLARAFDGNIQTYFDAPVASGAWVGLDFGTATTITNVKFVPRFGYASRMVGGKIQASNSATFGPGTVTAYTVTTAPAQAVTTTVNPTPVGSYRYWRYLGPNNAYCDIAELEFDG